MKKTLFFVSAMALMLLTACNKEMAKPEQIQVNPSPLEVKGGNIEADITGTFPAKKFNKKGILTVTPVLKYNGQEVLGESVTYVGEKAKANGTTVNYKAGGNYSQKFACKYEPAMASGDLHLRFLAIVGKDTVAIPDVQITDGGVNTTETLVSEDVASLGQVTPDKYQRIIQELTEADIKFLIQQATLRSSETKSQGIKDLRAAIKAANDSANKAINKIEVAGYASPDGGLDLNEGLAEKRQTAAQKFLQKQLKKDKINAGIDSKITAEDWEGFQELMESSNIKDKELVLRVLSMYSDPEERETQIKNLAAVYETIADEILPALRRSRLILTTDLIGRSDDEILAQYRADATVLSLEELLYAASLVEASEKKAVYNKVIELHPGDYRAYNNLGLLYFNEGNTAEARRCFSKALEIEPNNADVNYNAGLAAMAEGDLDKAGAYLGKAAGTNADLGSAMGTYYTLKGDYSNATKAYGKTPSNAAAVQQILNEDYAAARQTLAGVATPNATTAYLAAIVGARTNDREAVYANLRTAIAKDASLKAQAANDVEFAKFAEDATFQGIVK